MLWDNIYRSVGVIFILTLSRFIGSKRKDAFKDLFSAL